VRVYQLVNSAAREIFEEKVPSEEGRKPTNTLIAGRGHGKGKERKKFFVRQMGKKKKSNPVSMMRLKRTKVSKRGKGEGELLLLARGTGHPAFVNNLLTRRKRKVLVGGGGEPEESWSFIHLSL